MPGNLDNFAPQPPVHSLWIGANAGSGKTYVLTRQVVKLLLLGVPPERICCITYTKAAASEMRRRVIDRLRALLLADDATCRQQVEEALEGPATPEIMARARLLFGTVLDSMSGGIQLTTIHGFCQQLLRAFPIEAEVPPHFTVAEEGAMSLLLRQVRHRMLSGPYDASPELAAAIQLFVDRAGEYAFDQLLQSTLGKRRAWQQAWSGVDAATYKARLYEAIGIEQELSERTLIQLCMELPDATELAAWRAAIPALESGAGYQRELASALQFWLASPPEQWAEGVELWLNGFLTKSERTPIANLEKYMAKQGGALQAAHARARDNALRFVQQRAALALAEEAYAIALNARQMLLLYSQLKRERAMLDYDDQIEQTRRLLTTSGMTPWVMTKLDHRLDHLLIDEAQDTSADQWYIARALVDELVATGGGVGSAGVPRTLFVVGDEKQSIYSFQGADPALYARKHGEFAAALAHATAPLRDVALEHSYRSAQAILTLVDALGDAPAMRASLSASGQPQPHRRIKDHPGQVVIHPLLPAQEKAKPTPFAIPTEYQITATTAQKLGETVAAQIAAWIEAGTWRPKDILLLIQTRTFILPLLRALQRAGIPVAGIDRLVLADHLGVQDLLALMRWTATRTDDLALAQVLRSPLIGVDEDALYAIAHARGDMPLWFALEQRRPDIAETLKGWLAHAGTEPYDFLTHVLEVTGTRRQFATRFGEEVHEILDELKELAAHLPEGLTPNLLSFAAWVAGDDRQVKRELEQGEQDLVRIMTVHGSKGLEAPCVLLVDTVRMPDTAKESLFLLPTLAGQTFPLVALSDPAKSADAYASAKAERLAALRAEYYRLLYVAATRPRQALHVFGMEQGNRSTSPDSWYGMLRAAVLALPGTREDEEGRLIFEDANYQSLPSPATSTTENEALPAWVTTAPARPQVAPSLSPSRLAAAPLAPFAKQRGTGAKERGVRLHRILQFLSAGMNEDQLAQLITHLAPDWSDAEQARAGEEIWALFTGERWLWEHPAQAEVNISGAVEIAGTSYPVIGQIDRLVHTPDEVIVLDYKTGRDIPAPTEVSSAYLLQLKLYVALLETLYPGKRVRPAIVWTAGPALMWLDDAVKATSWDAAELPKAA